MAILRNDSTIPVSGRSQLQSLIAVINHECFTPLHGLINLSELAIDSSESESQLVFRCLNESAKKLANWVNILTQIVRLENELELKKSIEKPELLGLSYLLEQKIPNLIYHHAGKSQINTNCSDKLNLYFPESDFCLLIAQSIQICQRYQTVHSNLTIDVSQPKASHTLLTCKMQLNTPGKAKWATDNKAGFFNFDTTWPDPACYVVSLLIRKHGLLSNTYLKEKTMCMNFLFMQKNQDR